MPQNMEEEDYPQEQPRSRARRVASILGTVIDKSLGIGDARAVERAQKFQELAASYTEAETAKKGKALLFAGKLYITGRRLDTGTKVLESATEPLRESLRLGTLDAYLICMSYTSP
jgi:hypothetical protein